jgi:hypothetical protein
MWYIYVVFEAYERDKDKDKNTKSSTNLPPE